MGGGRLLYYSYLHFKKPNYNNNNLHLLNVELSSWAFGHYAESLHTIVFTLCAPVTGVLKNTPSNKGQILHNMFGCIICYLTLQRLLSYTHLHWTKSH